MKGWIYNLPKAQLIEEAVGRGVDTSGTLDDIRRRMSMYVVAHPNEFGAHGDEPTTAAQTPPRTVPLPNTANPAPPNSSEVLCQMRKWGCHFDGRDPFDFLERLEELKTGHRYPEAAMLLGLPELLKGDALRWCRNTRHRWQTWGILTEHSARNSCPADTRPPSAAKPRTVDNDRAKNSRNTWPISSH
ncbi:hypothetical protein ACS0PU_001135 [Formica fusca]